MFYLHSLNSHSFVHSLPRSSRACRWPAVSTGNRHDVWFWAPRCADARSQGGLSPVHLFCVRTSAYPERDSIVGKIKNSDFHFFFVNLFVVIFHYFHARCSDDQIWHLLICFRYFTYSHTRARWRFADQILYVKQLFFGGQMPDGRVDAYWRPDSVVAVSSVFNLDAFFLWLIQVISPVSK